MEVKKRHTLLDLSLGSFSFEEPPGFRRIARSIAEISLLTGIVMRVYRALVLGISPDGGALYTVVTFMFGALVFFGLIAIHLANFPLKQWAWRVPLFGLLESAGEMFMSLILITLGREAYGSVRAEWSNWTSMAWDTIVWRMTAVIAFAILLAPVVQIVRRRRVHAERLRHGVPPAGVSDRRQH